MTDKVGIFVAACAGIAVGLFIGLIVQFSTTIVYHIFLPDNFKYEQVTYSWTYLNPSSTVGWFTAEFKTKEGTVIAETTFEDFSPLQFREVIVFERGAYPMPVVVRK